MRTPTKLNKKQQDILERLEKEYKEYQKEVSKRGGRIKKLFGKASREKIPATQVSKRLGISAFAVQQRYQREGLPH